MSEKISLDSSGVTYIKKDVGFSQDIYHKLNKKH